MTAAKRTGRPLGELTPKRREALRKTQLRVETSQEALAVQTALAVEEGASIRAIAETLGIAKETARRLVAQGGNSLNGADATSP